jgi:hypothetical protein
MPNNFSVVHVTQYKPDSYTTGVRDDLFQWESSIVERTFDEVCGEYNAVSLTRIQNPRPIAGVDGFLTDDPDEWSDSPALAPTLSDNLRFAYGRDGHARYGKLDVYSGVVINQILAGKEGSYNIYEELNKSSIGINSIVKYIDGSVLMEETEQVSNQLYVYQYNFMVSAKPKPFSYKNPINTDVSIRLSNYIYVLNSGTVTLSLDGEDKDLEVVPFHGGLEGFDATWYNDKSFDYDDQIQVEWNVYDTAVPPNKIIVKYWFRTVRDLTGPRIYNVDPVDDEVSVDVNTCISFDVKDFELGVNINSLEFYVNNILVPLTDMTITVLSSEDGYHVSYCPTTQFLYGDVIPVSIYVEDSSPDKNSLFYVFSFTTEVSSKPLLVENIPRAFDDDVSIETDISVVISDGGSGLEEESTALTIDGVEETEAQKEPIIYRQE